MTDKQTVTREEKLSWLKRWHVYWTLMVEGEGASVLQKSEEAFQAIRSLLLAVGEWQMEIRELFAKRTSQEHLGNALYELAREIRDFGEEGKK